MQWPLRSTPRCMVHSHWQVVTAAAAAEDWQHRQQHTAAAHMPAMIRKRIEKCEGMLMLLLLLLLPMYASSSTQQLLTSLQ